MTREEIILIARPQNEEGVVTSEKFYRRRKYHFKSNEKKVDDNSCVSSLLPPGNRFQCKGQVRATWKENVAGIRKSRASPSLICVGSSFVDFCSRSRLQHFVANDKVRTDNVKSPIWAKIVWEKKMLDVPPIEYSYHERKGWNIQSRNVTPHQ